MDKSLSPDRTRARKLLLAHLTTAQTETYLGGGYFDVYTPGSKPRIWRLGAGGLVLVKNPRKAPVIPRGPEGSNWCWHVDGKRYKALPIEEGDGICVGSAIAVPYEDELLALKLILESRGGEAELLEIGNG